MCYNRMTTQVAARNPFIFDKLYGRENLQTSAPQAKATSASSRAKKVAGQSQKRKSTLASRGIIHNQKNIGLNLNR